MAEIDVTCPQCGNRRGVPSDLAGKKIKCKKCQSVFTVKAPPGPAKPDAKPPAKPGAIKADPKAPIPIKKDDDDEDDKNPYVMHEVNLAARCPFCAQLMDPPDAQICIHCGFDLRRRRRVERKVTYERTPADYMLWHLPTIGAFVGIGIAIAITVVMFIKFGDWITGSDLEDFLPASCFQVWIIIFLLIPLWFGGRFIFRRLVWNIHPPEKEKKTKEDDE